MIRVQLVIFAGVSRPHFRNDYQICLDFTHFLSSRDNYLIPVGKHIFGTVIKEQILS